MPKQPKTSSNLRDAILVSATQLLDEFGPAGLSMREVARRAGCTHQAPYHYFTNREAIITALVTGGFTSLSEVLASARDEGDAVAIGYAYVRFALENPGVFRIMFRSDMYTPESDVNFVSAVASSRKQLSALCKNIYPQASEEQQMALWAYVHGLATLLLDGPPSLQFSNNTQRLTYAKRVLEQGLR